MAFRVGWNKQLNILVTYAQDNGMTVDFVDLRGASSWIRTDIKKITIDKNLNLEFQTYDLVHELGHFVQQQNTHEYKQAFLSTFDSFSKKSLTYKIKILEEEIDAWNKGLILCDQLGVRINKRMFEIRKASRIASYATWAIK